MTALPAFFKSFDTRPLGRMFWKEYRQQRALWIAVLFGGFALQFAMRLMVKSDFGLFDGLWQVPLFLSAFYLIGSSAMLFALEREERTCDWLLNLSAPPIPILVAKFTFTIVSSLCLLVTLCLSAMVFSFGSGDQLNWFFRERVEGQLFVAYWLLSFGLVGSGLLIWSTLGSLTSRRVVTAVPAGLAWWLVIGLGPLAIVHYVDWLLYGQRSMGRGWDWIIGSVIVLGYVVTMAMNISLGLRWCRGEYFDASWWSALHDRLLAKLNWQRVHTTRVPSTIENEHPGWRTWQRLVWQERHRESLHTLLLVIVSAIGVLSAVYSLGSGDSLTFVVIPFLAAIPFGMGVIGFRFDSAGQQLRFLANRGASPAMIWSAKHAVWLPRAFWIPLVCWAVACVAESVFVPWPSSAWISLSDQELVIRHPLLTSSYRVLVGTGSEPGHVMDLLWFALASYAVGQAAAMLMRRMVLAVGVGFLLTILLAGGHSFAVEYRVPRWWAIGGVVLWFIGLAWWYSSHWLIERRNGSVVKRLALGLTLPPLMLCVCVAVYRWLEIPGFGPSSPTVMTLMYPREAQRRERLGVYGMSQLVEIRAAIEQTMQPVSPEDLVRQEHLSQAAQKCLLMERVPLDLDGQLSAPAKHPADPPFGGAPVNATTKDSPEERQRAAEELFWSWNKEPLEEILNLVTDDLPASYRIGQVTASDDDVMIPSPELLNVAGRLSLKQGDPKKAMAYYLAGLRLSRCRAFHFAFWATVLENRNPAARLLQSIVDWANEDGVSREQLLAAIRDVKLELSRFPSLREMSVNAFVWAEKDLQFQLKSQLSPVARCAAAALLSQELARRRRMDEQELFWRWNGFRWLESLVKQPQCNPYEQFSEWENQVFGTDRLDDEDPIVQFALNSSNEREKGPVAMFLDREAVHRQTLLALTLAVWRKEHHGELPESLNELAPYCENGVPAPERVLPVLALNDPWCGGMFGYSTQGVEISLPNGAKPDGDVEPKGTLLVPSFRTRPFRMAAERIQPDDQIAYREVVSPHGLFPTRRVAICLQKGRLKLVIFPRANW
jgi:hypothetical protein